MYFLHMLFFFVSQVFNCNLTLFLSLMSLQGIVLPEVIDNISFFLNLPVIFSALGLDKIVYPLFLRLQLVFLRVIIIHIELWLESVIRLCHVHCLFLSQVHLENVGIVLLPLRLQWGLDINLFLKRLKFVLNMLVFLIWVHLQVRACHIEERTLSPVVFSVLLSGHLSLNILNLGLLSVGYFVRPFNLWIETHLGHLVRGLEHALLVLTCVWVESIWKAARAVVQLVASCGMFDGAFLCRLLLLSQHSNAGFWRTQRSICGVVEIEFMRVDDPIHESMAVVCPGKWRLGHLIHHHGSLFRHCTSVFTDPNSVCILLDGVHAWVLGQTHGWIRD